MNRKNGEYLEIEEIPSEPASAEVGRGLYRMPVREGMNFSVIINNIQYPLLDVSSRGVRISVEPETSIAAEDTVPDCRLILDKQVFSKLEGKIIHYSLDDDGEWICGINWINIDTSTEKEISEVLDNLRKELFKYD
ncbi:hypothetical protein [Motiliproteus sp. MSK22-1]|uniref:hypothetical protein n=1 Tax=Motiliproteus sp. MSK22-1 TaxID=1897630 RepID=UPI00097898AE|nr:hypothetical protein [Motiliproteus sp. MSK22-1]OMH25579.1 hypothetical protein BGP75_23795 [Motiliproteus sp. MSK22-1]